MNFFIVILYGEFYENMSCKVFLAKAILGFLNACLNTF